MDQIWLRLRFSVPSRQAPGQTHPPAGGVPVLYRDYSDRSKLLTTHHLLVPDCEWLGATPTADICHGETFTFTIINTFSVTIHYNYPYYC